MRPRVTLGPAVTQIRREILDRLERGRNKKVWTLGVASGHDVLEFEDDDVVAEALIG